MFQHPEVSARLARDADRTRREAVRQARLRHLFRTSAPSDPFVSARSVRAGAARVRAQG